MRVLTGLLLLGLLVACGPQYLGPPVGDRSAGPAQIPTRHRVATGDTLFSIAFMYGLTVEELADWNRIRAPYTIYRGQELRLTPAPQLAAAAPPRPVPPPSRPKVQQRPPPLPSRPKTGALPTASQPKTALAIAAPAPMPAVPPSAGPAPAEPAPAVAAEPQFATHLSWDWPADGRLLRRFDATRTGGKGIDIAGHAGASVRAAAPGKVVYAGSGLSGYGRLIIIKHNEEFLSAYAHNRKLLATEGQWVNKHEVIAHMGSSGADRTALHFEIRKRGRPVNPLDYLPRR